MGNSGSEGIERPREKLRNLYEHEGEAAVRTERDEAEHQTARACGNLEEVTSEYLTALAAVHSAGQLIDIYDASDACGDVHHFAGSVLWKEPIRVQLEIPGDVEIPDHVEGAIEAVEQCNENECSPGYWRREETTVEAVSEGNERVFQTSAQAPLKQLHEDAKAERQPLSEKVKDRHKEFEQLRLCLRRCNDFLSEVLRGEIEQNEEPLAPEAKRRRLRDIAEKYTDEIEAVRNYLNQCPNHAWPESRTAAFDSVFPEEGRKAYERFRRRWERANLNFPGTVEQLHEECQTALKFRDDFDDLLSHRGSCPETVQGGDRSNPHRSLVLLRNRMPR